MKHSLTKEERISNIEKAADLKKRLNPILKKRGMTFVTFTRVYLKEIDLSYATINGMINGIQTMRLDVEKLINEYLNAEPLEAVPEKF